MKRPDVSAANRARWADPAYRTRMSSVNKARWDDPVYRESVVSGLRRNWKDPVYRARMEGVLQKRVPPKVIPKKGTQDYRRYCKIRDIVGAAEARKALGIESTLWLTKQAAP